MKALRYMRMTALLLAALCCLQFAACARPAATANETPTFETVACSEDGATTEETPSETVNEVQKKLDEYSLMRGIVASSAPLRSPDNAFYDAQFDLACALFKACVNEGKGQNTLVSPLSVLIALAMTANGARGQTLSEMEEVLGGGMPIGQLNDYLNTYLYMLSPGKNSDFAIADSIWFKDDGSFEADRDFLQLNADIYDAQIYKRVFDNQTVDLINEWCDLNTDGMIPKIIEELDPDTAMILLNAICFEAKWREVYADGQVYDGEFTAQDGSTTRVEFMHSVEDVYLDGGNAVGFKRPYAGGHYSFVALRPNDDVDVYDYIASLDGETLRGIMKNTEPVGVYAAIPKFDAEYSVSLSKVLSDLGMPTAFDPTLADFSGLGSSSAGNLCIGGVAHKTFIKVDENGTKAAAVTDVTVPEECEPFEPEEYKTVTLDRPFVYMIVNNGTNLPVFIGVQTDV